VNPIPRWRIIIAVLILGAVAAVVSLCAPYYFRNLDLQSFVADLTRNAEQRARPDAEIRGLILEKAGVLGLPVTGDNVRINRQADGPVKIDVRYVVPVELPGYTITLHFYPGAGSR
jgi:hypothetical protein